MEGLQELIELAEQGEFTTIGQFLNYIYTKYDKEEGDKLVNKFNKEWRK